MKRVISAGLLFLLLACSRLEVDSSYNAKTELTFTAYREGFEEATKTERGEVNSSGVAPVYWLPGDAVSLFFNSGAKGGNKFIAQNQTKAEKVEFKGTIDSFAGGGEGSANGYYFWAVYPYSDDVSCDGETVTLSLPATQMGKVGSFDNGLFPTVAKAKGLELGFYNIARGIKFTVAGKDKNGTERSIRKVKFKGNSSEKLAGKVKVGWDTNGYPEVRENLEEVYEVSVSAPNGGTFIPGEEYFIVFLPGVFENGFSLTFITDDGKQGTYNYPNKFSFDRGWFGRLRGLDGYISEWTESDDPTTDTPEYTEGGTESGLYLGITYFDSILSNYPVQLLTEETIDGFNSFIDNRSDLGDETLLYYSVDKSMARLQASRFPDDLFSVAIVTFTDGQDDGSVGWKEDETGKTYYKGDYEKELAEILEGKVSGLPIMAYSIGLDQLGVSNNTSFINNLKTIAHPASNFSLLSEMPEVNEKFSEIAKELSNTIKLQKLVGTIPRQASGTKIRFTYDNVSSATISSLYIEGVYSSPDFSLQGVKYNGFTSTSGSVVVGVRKGKNKVIFTFEGIHREGNEDVTMDYFKRWIYDDDTSSWEEYRETSYEDAENGIIREMKSAAIILNLDCTESLGPSKFSLLKQYSKNFIQTLYDSSIDPEAVRKVSISGMPADMVIGETANLIATISPSTAIEKSVTWESSNPDIVSVSNDGEIQAKSLGTATITVVTKDGGKTASCEITVLASRPVTSVTMQFPIWTLQIGSSTTLIATVKPDNATDKSLIWSSSNPDVVDVSAGGVITGMNVGTATVTAFSADGEHSATCEVTVTYSTTPQHLALAVQKNGSSTKYYLTSQQYGTADLTDYTKLGVCVKSTVSFIVKLFDSTTATAQANTSRGSSISVGAPIIYNNEYTATGTTANTGKTMPNLDQAKWICNNMPELNTALTSFGGSAMSTTANYWTSYYRGGNKYYYYKYNLEPTLDGGGTMKCRMREVTSL